MRFNFLKANVVAAQADSVIFENVLFDELNYRGLDGLEQQDNSSVLTFKNICINGPTYGSFLNNFRNVKYENITAKVCRYSIIP